MKYVAAIARILHPAIHRMGGIEDRELAVAPFPRPDRAEIQCEGSDGPCFLIRYTTDGKFCGDTWHETFSDAIDQAKLEYGLSEQDFIAVQ